MDTVDITDGALFALEDAIGIPSSSSLKLASSKNSFLPLRPQSLADGVEKTSSSWKSNVTIVCGTWAAWPCMLRAFHHFRLLSITCVETSDRTRIVVAVAIEME